jgi:hypothetical protein
VGEVHKLLVGKDPPSLHQRVRLGFGRGFGSSTTKECDCQSARTPGCRWKPDLHSTCDLKPPGASGQGEMTNGRYRRWTEVRSPFREGSIFFEFPGRWGPNHTALSGERQAVRFCDASSPC